MQTRIQSFVQESINTFLELTDPLTNQIMLAGHLIFKSMIAEGKVISCGNGESAICAQYFTTKLLNHFIQERPSLPAICLTTDAASLTAISDHYGFSEIYAKQIRALGNNKDILLTITSHDKSANIIEAIQAAHDREMSVIALTATTNTQIRSILLTSDIEICVPSYKIVQIQQAHLLIVNILCDLIDHQLFGSE